MPKIEIDYSNTIIYKITCKDSNVKDVYVGHTTNFVQRKHAHKQSCINDKSPNYNCKLYDVIRNNGGWNNWKMEIINFFNCQDHYEARKKEQEYFVSLNATLNSIEPMPKPKIKPILVKEIKEKQIFYCETCNIYCSNSNLLEIHNKTKKHNKISEKKINNVKVSENIDSNKKDQKSSHFVCEKCSFETSRKSQFDRHLLTSKHTRITKDNKMDNKKVPNIYSCICGNKYNYLSGLCKHKKKCSFLNNNQEEKEEYVNNDTQALTKLVLEVVKSNNELQKQNQEFQQKMIESFQEVCKNSTNNNSITNSNINSHNKTFNLQFFLNETCKNAMNISDFVDSIKLQLSDLENVAKIGYVEGLSKIIIKNLKALDVTERPVHCSDSKRDTMYVKDEDKWEKENENNHKVLKAIEDIANKNSKMVKEWKIKNPECSSSKSFKADVYSHIMIQAVCSNNDANNNKILKKIAKEVTIDKS